MTTIFHHKQSATKLATTEAIQAFVTNEKQQVVQIHKSRLIQLVKTPTS